MAKKIKDTDYLAISTRIRAMENTLLTRERMEQVLEARSDEEAVKILQECGYPELDPAHPEAMDAALAQARESVLEDLGDSAPDARYLDVFKLKYDYHNLKALLKAEAMEQSPERLLTDLGRLSGEEMRRAVENGEDLPGRLNEALAEAREILQTTRDPQLSDIALDRWCYVDMMDVAEATGSAFLRGYVRSQIDGANLRSLVRTLRMGKNADFLRLVLFEGGTVDVESILQVSAAQGAGLAELYAPTELRAAAEAGAESVKGGPLTDFERLCDDAAAEYLSGAQTVPFGEAPLLGYLAARETEYTNLRILLLGRMAGLAPELIRARLRRSYV